jgi:hypothetical protein
VTGDNLYQQTQFAAEHGFFDGSTQKGDFLSALGRQLLRQVMEKPELMTPVIVKALSHGLLTKQVMMTALTKPVLEEAFEELHWNGAIQPVPCQDTTDCAGDYLYINEANFGINKTNCCLDRELEDTVRLTGEAITHELKIRYINHNPGTPEPPLYWGGGYKAYVRVIVPQDAEIIEYRVDGQAGKTETLDILLEYDRTVVGLLVGVPGKGEATIELTYRIPQNKPVVSEYRLLEQKQSGIDYWPIHRYVNDREYTYQLETDTTLDVEF